jgi:hypothetical protein
VDHSAYLINASFLSYLIFTQKSRVLTSDLRTMDAAIDQVIQSGVPEHTSQWGWGATHSVPSRGSPRRKQDTTGVQSNSGQGIERTRSPAISEYGHKAPSAKSSNLRQGDAKDDESISSRSRGREREMIDCFGSDVFRIVLNNPTTSQRFLRFCQAHGRGESVEFLEKVSTLIIPYVNF